MPTGCLLPDLAAELSVMMRHVPFLISIIAGLLWIVAFKFLGRLLGIPLPTNFQQRAGVLRLLSFNEYVCLYGALGFGIAMWITSVADDYFQGTMLGNPSPHAAMWRVFELVWWLAGGCAFGWMVWGGYRDTHYPSAK
jgi:hypothetical protein